MFTPPPRGRATHGDLTQTFDPRVGILTVLSNSGWGQFDKLVFSSHVLCSLQKNFDLFCCILKIEKLSCKDVCEFWKSMPIYFEVCTRVFYILQILFITYLNLEIRIKFWPLFFIFSTCDICELYSSKIV